MEKRLVDAIVISTVAETLRRSRKGSFSVFELEGLVGEVAADFGASGALLAELIGHVPQLCTAVRGVKTETTEATVTLSDSPQYEVWTGGRREIVESIGKYERKKGKYMFWADLTAGECLCLGKRRRNLQPKPLELLLLLAEKIGTSVPRRDIFEIIFQQSPEKITGWKNRIEQLLTKLQNFSGRRFRKLYLKRDRLHDTLSLDRSFLDAYFVCRRLR